MKKTRLPLIIVALIFVVSAELKTDDDLRDERRLCGGFPLSMFAETAKLDKNGGETQWRCVANSRIAELDNNEEGKEFCENMLPMTVDQVKRADGTTCRYIPAVECDEDSSLTYFSSCIKILPVKNDFATTTLDCKNWGGELISTPNHHLLKWIYKIAKGTYWTNIATTAPNSKLATVLYTVSIITKGIRPGQLYDDDKTKSKHGGVCAKRGKLTPAGHDAHMKVMMEIHPRWFKHTDDQSYYFTNGVYLPKTGGMKPDFSNYDEICSFVEPAGDKISRVGIPNAAVNNFLKQKIETSTMIGTTGFRTQNDDVPGGCGGDNRFKDRQNYFAFLLGKSNIKVEQNMWMTSEPSNRCADQRNRALIMTKDGIRDRPSFVRTRLFCLVGKLPDFAGFNPADRCHKEAKHDSKKNICACRKGYIDVNPRREKGTECMACPFSDRYTRVLFGINYKLKREHAINVVQSIDTAGFWKQSTHASISVLPYAWADGFPIQYHDRNQLLTQFDIWFSPAKYKEWMDKKEPVHVFRYGNPIHNLDNYVNQTDVRKVFVMVSDENGENGGAFGLTKDGDHIRAESFASWLRAKLNCKLLYVVISSKPESYKAVLPFVESEQDIIVIPPSVAESTAAIGDTVLVHILASLCRN